jgi:hypothetical protein
VVVVIRCTECLGFLAKGLRAEFAPHFRSFLVPLLENFKEKKATSVKAIHDALINMHPYSYTLLDITTDLIEVFKHKTPSVRQQSLIFCTALLKLTPKSFLLPKKLQPLCLSLVAVSSSVFVT